MDDPPHLTLAAEQSTEDLERREKLEMLHWPLREFMANALRVMRGAGRPIELPEQIISLALTVQEAGQAGANIWSIGDEIETVLQSAMVPELDERGVAEARRTIQRGVLQMLASELVGHTTIKRKGETEIQEGVRRMEEAWAENRRRWEDEWRAQHPVRQNSRRRPRRKPVSKPKFKETTSPEPESEVEFTGSTAEFMKKRAAQLARDS